MGMIAELRIGRGVARGMARRRGGGWAEGRAGIVPRVPALRFRAVVALSALLLAACGGGTNSHPSPPENGSRLSVSPARGVEGSGSGSFVEVAAGTMSGKPAHGRLPERSPIPDVHDLNRYGEAWESAGWRARPDPAASRPVRVAHPISPTFGAGDSIWNLSGVIATPVEAAAAPVGERPAVGNAPVVHAGAGAGDVAGSASSGSRYFQQDSRRLKNIRAADLRTSWNDTGPVTATLGLAAPTKARAGALKSALGKLKASHADAAGSAAALPKVPDGSITVLGERDGIAYGVWKGGPAGTVPVTFYFGPHQTSSGKGFVDWKGGMSREFMAVLRRSTKIWTRRLLSDGKRRDVTIKVVEGNRYRAVDTVKDVEGIVVQVRLNDFGRVSAGPISYDSGTDGDRFMPYYGNISISSHVHDNLHDGMAHSVAHEFGHVLGITHYGINLYKDTYYDPKAHTWSGPNAMRANGGKPVPLQWVDGRKWWEVEEPHAEGARRDASHLGVCSSVMAYCADTNAGGAPSELDFAILADFGFNVLDPKVAAETERYGHAAWGAWAAWGVSVERDLRDNFHEAHNDWTPIPHDFLQAHADAFGTAPATALSDNAALRGKAVWNGRLLGVDLGIERLPPVVGDAKLRVDLGEMDGELRLRNLTVHLGGGGQPIRTRPFRQSALQYGIDISGNGFADAGNRVRGSFFGPDHQEMAGVVKDVRPEVQLLGGFGGVRAAD